MLAVLQKLSFSGKISSFPKNQCILQSYGLGIKSNKVFQMKDETGDMVLKGVNWIHHEKLCERVLNMVLKEVNWVDNNKIRSNGLERSHLIPQ